MDSQAIGARVRPINYGLLFAIYDDNKHDIICKNKILPFEFLKVILKITNLQVVQALGHLGVS